MNYRWRFFIVMMIASQIGLVALALFTLFSTSQPPVLFAKVVGAQDSVCPGEEFSMLIEVNVSGGQQVLQLVDSWWSVDKQATAVFDDEPLYSVHVESVSIERVWLVTVPALAPGRYEYRIGVSETGRRSAVASVPFTVLSCP